MNTNEIKLNYIRDKYLFYWLIKLNSNINICGEVDEVNTDLSVLVLEGNYIPLISPIFGDKCLHLIFVCVCVSWEFFFAVEFY